MLFDALGTLVHLDDPAGGLARQLAARGAAVSEPDAMQALVAEMTYYRTHCDEARDEAALADLHDRCAAVLQEALPSPARELPFAEVRAALLQGLTFSAFDDAEPTLRALREAGCALAVVSNWDVSLHGVLRDTGLGAHVDAVLTSAEERVAKPDPEIFTRALERLGGVSPDEALHVGDDVASDARGAQAAGVPVVLVDRGGLTGVPDGVGVVSSLSELVPARR